MAQTTYDPQGDKEFNPDLLRDRHAHRDVVALGPRGSFYHYSSFTGHSCNSELPERLLQLVTRCDECRVSLGGYAASSSNKFYWFFESKEKKEWYAPPSLDAELKRRASFGTPLNVAFAAEEDTWVIYGAGTVPVISQNLAVRSPDLAQVVSGSALGILPFIEHLTIGPGCSFYVVFSNGYTTKGGPLPCTFQLLLNHQSPIRAWFAPVEHYRDVWACALPDGSCECSIGAPKKLAQSLCGILQIKTGSLLYSADTIDDTLKAEDINTMIAIGRTLPAQISQANAFSIYTYSHLLIEKELASAVPRKRLDGRNITLRVVPHRGKLHAVCNGILFALKRAKIPKVRVRLCPLWRAMREQIDAMNGDGKWVEIQHK